MTAESPLLTFLFTDIEGSTRLWDQYPDAMRHALARHDELLRAAIEEHGGHVFKTIGDAFCAVFPAAPKALSAVIAAQRALCAEPWEGITERGVRVRMALHTGPAEQRANDYFGPTLNRVARFLSAGHGGQILLSQASADLVQPALPPGAALRDLGERRLKDLARPERIFQIVYPQALPDDFPPLRSLEAFVHNLPVQATRFIGREREVEQVRQRLAATRLLTLVGPGGCGKTRLAIQAAAERIEEHDHGVWLIELAPLTDPALVPQTVASILGAREEPGRSLSDSLADFLRPKSLLLVLDNCEHLIEACARLADRLLAGCPDVRILASSREALGIAGETMYPVPTLETPDPRRLPPLDVLARQAAVQLFVDRAVASQASFVLSHGNAPAVAQVCHRLDGIPLAIELAAARVKVLSPEQIATRLDDRFRLLTGGSRAALPRQQTLRALTDWSYDLLSEGEKQILARLAVFAGGWTLEAAEAVAAGGDIEEWEVLDLLAHLSDKSLVVVDENGSAGGGGEVRYRLLQTVRQYALERLGAPADVDEASALAERHGRWFLDLAGRAESEMGGAGQAAWLERLETEYDNLRGALDWSLAHDPEAGLRATGALWKFWSVRGYFSEGRDRLARVLEHTSNGANTLNAERAKAFRAAGALASNQGDYAAAQTLLEQSLAIWRALGDRRGAAGALNSLGNVAWRRGEFAAARALYQESVDIARALDDSRGVAVALISLGNVACQQGEYDAARALYEEALATTRARGNREWEAANLQNLGDVIWLQGDYVQARALYEQSLVIRRELGDKQGIAASLGNLGNVASQQGDYVQARALYEEALAINREMGDRQWESIGLINLGDLAIR